MTDMTKQEAAESFIRNTAAALDLISANLKLVVGRVEIIEQRLGDLERRNEDAS